MAESRPLASMTGFARREGADAHVTWTWEVKSVNGRSLDLRCRIPPGYERLEAAARTAVPEVCARGNVSLTLTVNRAGATPNLRVNEQLLDQVIALAGELQKSLGGHKVAPPRLDGLLGIQGVLEAAEREETPEETAAREAAMKQDLKAALDDLVVARRAEGAHLKAVAEAHLATIEGLIEAASACAAVRPEALRQRLKAQVEELMNLVPALPEERLAQEAALLVVRSDVREELDRLRAHVASAQDLLNDGGTVGRRLDFLCQEFNREANTLCSKSSDVELTRVGLDLKGAVEQLREQVQNVE